MIHVHKAGMSGWFGIGLMFAGIALGWFTRRLVEETKKA